VLEITVLFDNSMFTLFGSWIRRLHREFMAFRMKSIDDLIIWNFIISGRNFSPEWNLMSNL